MLSPHSNINSLSDLGPTAFPLWPQCPHLPIGQVTQCCEKPRRSIKVNLWVPSVDPGTVRVSALAGEGGDSWGEGGLSSTMRGWLSASAYSTCTSGCSFVAGTWGEEGEDSQREREARSQGPWCSSRKTQKRCLEKPLAASPPNGVHRRAPCRGCKNAEPSGL